MSLTSLEPQLLLAEVFVVQTPEDRWQRRLGGRQPWNHNVQAHLEVQNLHVGLRAVAQGVRADLD